MFELTSSERKALVFFVGVILAGAILQYCRRNESFRNVFSRNITASGALQTVGSQRKINLNNASIEDLIVLPGIGPALAGRIVRYRTEYGPFKKAEDLTFVPGIGKTLLQRLLPYFDRFPSEK